MGSVNNGERLEAAREKLPFIHIFMRCILLCLLPFFVSFGCNLFYYFTEERKGKFYIVFNL